MSAAAIFLLGLSSGFPVWFALGWLACRDDSRQRARELARAHAAAVPPPVRPAITATAERVPAALPAGTEGGDPQ